MKLLLDQDVYAATATFLRNSGHDVITASDVGRSRASDSELLGLAHQWERVFVTRDGDFGGLVSWVLLMLGFSICGYLHRHFERATTNSIKFSSLIPRKS